MPSKPKGVIKKAKSKSGSSVSKGGGVKGAIKTGSKILSKAPGVLGSIGKVVSAGASLLGVDSGGNPVFGAKRRHKGLTYREIKGATKVLKLVKKFAPSGSKFKLKSRRNYQ